jgi:hypothetical protein
MKAFPLNQPKLIGIASKETLRSVILYVQIHNQSINQSHLMLKAFLSGWMSRYVRIIYGGTAGAAHNYQISLHRRTHSRQNLYTIINSL